MSQVFHWALSRQGQRALCPGVAHGVSVTAKQTPALLPFSPMAHSTDVQEFKSLFSLFFLLAFAFLTSLLLALFIFTPGNLSFFIF